MPVMNLLTSAASFLYAVASMLDGAQNNAAVQQSFVSNFQNTPTHFLPVDQRQRSPKAFNAQAQSTVNIINNHNLTSGGVSGSHNSASAYYPRNNGSYPHHTSQFSHKDNGDASFDSKASSSSSTLYLTLPQPIGDYHQGSDGKPAAFSGPIEISYHDGETIATLFTDEYGNVTRCEMLEVNKPSEQQEALANLAAQNKLIEKTNFNTMLNIIRACQALDQTPDKPLSVTRNPVQAIVQTKMNMWTVVSGILPGTKWCGLKDIADGWNDLGTEQELDKCCRSHDLCPRKVLAFRAAYGLVNWSFYTKSHCDCDARFYDCLKSASNTNPAAELMGNFYFNVLRVQCIEEENPPRCVNSSVQNGVSCGKWENDADRENQRLTFREVKQLFR